MAHILSISEVSFWYWQLLLTKIVPCFQDKDSTDQLQL